MKVFISYSSKDKGVAEQVYLALVKEGYAVFFDKQSLPISGDYSRRIRDEINKSDVLIFLISQYSVEKSYALTELKYFQDCNKNSKDKVLPVRLDDVVFEKIPGYLKAVTILEPEGNIVAETVYEVGRLKSEQRKPWLLVGTVLVFLVGMYFV